MGVAEREELPAELEEVAVDFVELPGQGRRSSWSSPHSNHGLITTDRGTNGAESPSSRARSPPPRRYLGIHEWEEDEVEAASLFADMATAFVVNTTELERTRESVAQLEQALESRIVVEQAKGIIAAEHNVSVDQAFEMLRTHARNHHANLHEPSSGSASGSDPPQRRDSGHAHPRG